MTKITYWYTAHINESGVNEYLSRRVPVRTPALTPATVYRGAWKSGTAYPHPSLVAYKGRYYVTTAEGSSGTPDAGNGWEVYSTLPTEGLYCRIDLNPSVVDIGKAASVTAKARIFTPKGYDVTERMIAEGTDIRWTYDGKERHAGLTLSIPAADYEDLQPHKITVTLPLLYNEELEGSVVLQATDTAKRAAEELEREARERKAADEQQQRLFSEKTAAMTALFNKEIAEMQKQVDGEVSNWFYPGSPGPSKPPESDWHTNGIKARHIGDTYTSTDKTPSPHAGKSWRYTTAFTWEAVADTEITKALKLAGEAKQTADGKSTTYLTQPAAYEEGDTWVLQAETNIGGKMYKAGSTLYAHAGSSSFRSADWSEVRYIGEERAEEIERQIQAIQVGGRNLLLGSGETKEGSAYLSAWYELVAPADLREGDEVTLTLWYEGEGEGCTFSLYNSGGNVFISQYLLASGKPHTFRWKSHPTNQRTLNVYRNENKGGVGNVGGNVTRIFRAKLERGNKGTDWSPALEELEERVKAEMVREIATAKTQAEEASKAFAAAEAERKRLEAEENAGANALMVATEQARLAKAYADAQDRLLEGTLKRWADGEITTLETLTKRELEARVALAKAEWEAYADGRVSAEERARIEALRAALAKAEQALTAAQTADRKAVAADSKAVAADKKATEADKKAAAADKKAEAVRAAQERMDYLTRVFTQGQTEIRGGAVLSEALLLKDERGVLTGYLNGHPDEGGKGAGGLVLGGEHLFTPEETRRVYLSPQGLGHIGRLVIYPDGHLGICEAPEDPQAVPSVRFGGSLRPLSDLVGASAKREGRAAGISLRETHKGSGKEVSGVLHVPHRQATLSVGGGVSIRWMPHEASNIGGERSGHILITLKDSTGRTVTTLAREYFSNLFETSRGADGWCEVSRKIDFVSVSAPSDRYTVEAEWAIDGGTSEAPFVLSASVSKFRWEYTPDVKEIVFSDDGVSAFFDRRRMLYVPRDPAVPLTIKGSTDMPGVLCAGRVNKWGTAISVWGAKIKTGSGLAVRKIGTGVYQVNHSIGHENYYVTANIYANGGDPKVHHANTGDYKRDSFIIRTVNHHGHYSDMSFTFMAVGDNV